MMAPRHRRLRWVMSIAILMTVSALTAVALTGGARAVQAAPRAAGPDGKIVITAGGDRTANDAVAGLDGARFEVLEGTTVVGTCATLGDGKCDVSVRAGDCVTGATCTVRQLSAPPGWFINPALAVGPSTTPATGTSTRYDQITGLVVPAAGTLDVPVAAPNSTADTARTGDWALSRAEPDIPVKCGLNVAMLFDLSVSIGTNLGAYKAAGEEFVSALQGTPSSIAVYTFGTSAPAASTVRGNNNTLNLTSVATSTGADEVRAKIGGLTLPPTTDGYTNWDQGLWQIANSNAHYDIVLMLTDGDPTRSGVNGSGGLISPVRTRFAEIENAIFSANAIKAHKTPVIAVGVNIAATSPSVENLRAISGTREGTDFFTTSFAGLGPLLDRLARENCDGTINITKHIVPTGQTSLEPSSPGVDWTFTASPSSSVTDHTGVTDENGAVSFKKTNPAASATLQFTETPPAAGYTLVPQAGANASCTSSTGRPVAVTNVDSDGFSVATMPDEVISCSVFDRAPPTVPDAASVIVDETWNINGATAAAGDQDADFQADLTLTPPVSPPPAEFQPNWGQEFAGYHDGQAVDIDQENVRIPAGCTITTTGDLGGHTLAAGLNTFHVLNTVTCVARLILRKEIANPFPDAQLAPLDSWTLTARRLTTGRTVISGTTGVSGTILSGKRYVLSESSVQGYHQQVDPDTGLVERATGSWHCLQVINGVPENEVFAGGDGTVTAYPGEEVECTATNIPEPGTLTLVKKVINAHGGTAKPSDWTLKATPEKKTEPPAPALSGVTGSKAVTNRIIPPGLGYHLSESGPAGYRASLSCKAVSGNRKVEMAGAQIRLKVGQEVTCTFTNTQKEVVPVTG